MDRYKFEDSISSYLDNEMNLKERQEFENYMDENPEARSLFENMKDNIHLIKEMSHVNTSPDFINKLFSLI